MTSPDPAALLAASRAELAQTPGVLDRLLAGLDAAAWRARPAPAEWAPVEIVCHLRDEEVEERRGSEHHLTSVFDFHFTSEGSVSSRSFV